MKLRLAKKILQGKSRLTPAPVFEHQPPSAKRYIDIAFARMMRHQASGPEPRHGTWLRFEGWAHENKDRNNER